MKRVTNIVISGLGGQGVLTASDMLSTVVFDAGLDVKKSEVHGMSQRGGSVSSDVRFGEQVLSPMVPPGEADFVVCLAPDWIEVSRPRLKPDGVMIEPALMGEASSSLGRGLNSALLGVLSAHLPFSEDQWLAALRKVLPEKLHAINEKAYAQGRAAGLETLRGA